MTFDELQKKWQSQREGGKLSIDSELLLKEVRRNKKSFESTIFWRDVREVGVAILVFVFFLYGGITNSIWELNLLALLVAGVATFLVVDRIYSKKRRPKFNGELGSCIESSLAEVKHQIWLLKNVLWWYLLPPGIGIGIFIGGMAISIIRDFGGKEDLFVLLFIFGYAVFCIFLFWGIYLLNQWAVRKGLVPRKQELEQLLASLSEN